MAISTVIGLLAALLTFLNAISDSPVGGPGGAQILLVVVGSLGATLVAYPGTGLIRVLIAAVRALFGRGYGFTELVQKVVGYAETARREGILALEPAASECGDSYTASGIRLAVDGTTPELIQSILLTELNGVEARHRQNHRMLSTFGWHCGAFGILAALIAVLTGETDTGLVAQVSLPVFYGLLIPK